MLDKVIRYVILQAVKQACCLLLEEESKLIISGMPEHMQEFAPVQVTLHDTHNPTVQLWHAANDEQLSLKE